MPDLRIALRHTRAALRLLLRAPRIWRAGYGTAELRTEVRRILELLGVELAVCGTERLGSGGKVLMWNHTSHLDQLVLPAILPEPTRVLYNDDVARIPLYGRWLAEHGNYLVVRGNREQWQESVAAAAAWAAAGHVIGTSPEGVRSRDGRLLPMKQGAFTLAMASRQPIQPIAIRGARALLAPGDRWVKPGVVELEVLAPIPTDEGSSMQQLQSRVAAALSRATVSQGATDETA